MKRKLAIALAIIVAFTNLQFVQAATVSPNKQEAFNEEQENLADTKQQAVLAEDATEDAAVDVSAVTEESFYADPKVNKDTIVVNSIEEFKSQHDYENNMDCTWIYTDTSAAELNVSFSAETALENGADFIYIYDENDNEIYKYTGTRLANQEINVKGNTIKVRLVTDSSNTAYGFDVSKITAMKELKVTQLPAQTRYLVGKNVDLSGFEVEYFEKNISDLIITEEPTRKNYYLGDTIDNSGLKVVAIDSMGNEYVVTEDCEYSDVDMNTLGEKEVVISFGGLTTSFNVWVSLAVTYSISQEGVQVKGTSDANVTKIVIPDTIEGVAVTSIANLAFSENDTLVHVELPNRITTIGEGAFAYCSSLKSINIPDGIVEIPKFMFYSCSSLEEIIIPDGVTHIGELVFGDCIGLKKLTMPCSANIYNSTTFGYDSGSFNYCKAIEELHLTKGTGVMPDYVLSKDANYTDSSRYYGNLPWTNSSVLKTVTLDEGITNIGATVFKGCEGITEVKLPGSVNKIGEYAFSGCKNLLNINIPEDVMCINKESFRDCISIKSIVIPDKVEAIFDSAFEGCTSLEVIELPNGITSIEKKAFYDCISLKNINIPDGIVKISDQLFYNCSSLEKVVIPDGVTHIGEKSFYKCSELEKLTMPCSANIYNDNTFSSNNSGSFNGCISIKELHLTKGTGEMPDYTFYMDDNVTDSSRYYKNLPWTNSSVLKTVILDEGITNIGSNVFRASYGLEEIRLPDSLMAIGNGAISDCIHLNILANKDSYAYTYAKENSIPARSTKFVNIVEESLSLKQNDSVTLNAEVIMFNGELDNAAKCSWSSSNKKIVDISSEGVVTVTGSGQATITATYESQSDDCLITCIVDGPIDLSNQSFSLSQNEYMYSGEECRPEVIFEKDYLTLNEDYSVIYQENVNAGTAKIVIQGINNYTGKIEAIFEIKAVEIKYNVPITINNQVYSGAAFTPEVIINEYIINKDYTVTYTNNINCGVAIANITFKGNYRGAITKTFLITQKNIASLKLDVSNAVYNGMAVVPNVKLC